MKKNLAVSTCVFALIALSAFTSHAADGSARTDILVTATVSSSCVIDAQNVVFGEYIPTAKEAIKAEGLIRLTCVKGSAPVVSIGGGANHNGTNRRAAYISQNSTDQTQIEYLKKVNLGLVECTKCEEKGLYARPSQATISRGQYALSRAVYYILKENATGLGTGFMNFMSLERGQLIFRRASLVPAKMGFSRRTGTIKNAD